MDEHGHVEGGVGACSGVRLCRFLPDCTSLAMTLQFSWRKIGHEHDIFHGYAKVEGDLAVDGARFSLHVCSTATS